MYLHIVSSPIRMKVTELKNMVLCTWGRDTNQNMIWHPMFYDCDSSLGLTNDGELTYGSGIDMERGDFNTYDSNLWVKLLRNFNTEIRVRYGFLRDQGWFTVDKILEYLDEGLISKIGAKFYNMDARYKYMGDNRGYAYLTNGNRLEHTKRWLTERISYLDSVYEYGAYVDMSATVRTNIKSVLTFQIKTYHPQMVTIRFQDGTTLLKKYCDNTGYTVFSSSEVDSFAQWGGVVQNDKDNNVAIMGVENILDIQGLEDMNVSHLLYSNMQRITTIEMPRAPIRELTLGLNTMLQKVNLKNCTKLGYNELTGQYDGGLDVSNCTNLRYLDISNTGLSRLALSDVGGNLDYFDASNTNITSISMVGQPYLEELKMENCTHLATVKAENCSELRKILIPNSQVNTFSVGQCAKMEEIDISNTASLNNLTLDGCPNLLKLNMSGFQNQNFTELNLTTCPKIQNLNISGCGYLTNISFETNCRTLKTFNCKNSAITAIRFGRQNDFPNYLDLSPFLLTSVSFENCPRVVNIKGLNYEGSGSRMFYGCGNLVTIETLTNGKLKCNNLSQFATSCAKLTTLPATIDFTTATNASEAFWGCSALSKSECKRVAQSCPKITNGRRMFSGTKSGSLDEDFFSNMGSLQDSWRMFEGNVTGELHPNLFKPLTNITDTTYMFASCSFTGGIPKGFFSANTKLKTTYNMFNGCSGLDGSIYDDLFENCPELTGTDAMFSGCNLTCRIPTDLFKNNLKLASCQSMFNSNKNLYGEVPATLFRGQGNDRRYPNLTNVASFVANCPNLTGAFPQNFFINCPNISNATSLFKGCTNITGDIPSDILQPCKNAILTVDYMFADTGASGGFPRGIFAGCRNISNVSGFFRNSKITDSIPNDLLADCTSLLHVAYLFEGCQGIVGQIPENLLANTGELLSVAGIFKNCRMLTSSIPEHLFDNCAKVTDMSYIFGGCWRITGDIPEDLFRNCTKVRTLANAFQDCKNLGNKMPSDINPYFMPPTLLHDCPMLENASYMFYQWGETNGGSMGNTSYKRLIPEDFFKNCPNLLECAGMFAGNSHVQGEIPSMFFYYNTKLQNIREMFWDSGFDAVGDDLFARTKDLRNVESAFRGKSNMTGTITPIWNTSEYKNITSYNERGENL